MQRQARYALHTDLYTQALLVCPQAEQRLQELRQSCRPLSVERRPSAKPGPWYLRRAALQVLLEVNGNLVATAADVETSAVQQVAAGRGELVGLALWVMQESRLVRTASNSTESLHRLLACSSLSLSNAQLQVVSSDSCHLN